ncbi:hypothetical protein Ancab_036577 [Ancistrocladus abbreviatus]
MYNTFVKTSLPPLLTHSSLSLPHTFQHFLDLHHSIAHLSLSPCLSLSLSSCEKMSSRNKNNNQCSPNQRSMFLPMMLCSRSSIQDVKLSHQRSASLSDDPLSPRVGCAGQIVKRNNKVIGFPTPHKLNFSASSRNVDNNNSDKNISLKYYKLKRFFSSKSLINSQTTATISAYSASTKTSKAAADPYRNCCRARRIVLEDAVEIRSKFDCGDSCGSNLINVADLDPPLPVIRKVGRQENDAGGEKDSLWTRRSGGVALQNLQVKSIKSCQDITHQATSA